MSLFFPNGILEIEISIFQTFFRYSAPFFINNIECLYNMSSNRTYFHSFHSFNISTNFVENEGVHIIPNKPSFNNLMKNIKTKKKTYPIRPTLLRTAVKMDNIIIKLHGYGRWYDTHVKSCQCLSNSCRTSDVLNNNNKKMVHE